MIIALDHWPPTGRQYALLKAAGKIKHVPGPAEQAADELRAQERAAARAVWQADELVRRARG